MIKIPPKIEYVIDILSKNGYEAYIVGGCVRDMLIGITPFDFDVTTSAKPEQVQSLFKKTIPTGIKHGTVTVVIDGETIEVTTFRKESNYLDNRHPESIEFVSDIAEDLSRRDFTVNALAYNYEKGIIDFHNGIADLNNKTLRTVGNAKERFNEDALRILRLFRFSSVLGFSIEKNTLNTAVEYAHLLSNISRERILPELQKTVTGKFSEALIPLINSNALSFLGIKNTPDFNVIKKLRLNSELAFFSFLYFSCEDINKALTELKVSNKTKDYCTYLGNIVTLPLPQTKSEIKKIITLAPTSIFNDYLEFKKATEKQDVSDINKMLHEIIENNEPFLISHLNINGKQIENLGYSGSEIGQILNKLLQIVIDSPHKNTYDNLINEITKISP